MARRHGFGRRLALLGQTIRGQWRATLSEIHHGLRRRSRTWSRVKEPEVKVLTLQGAHLERHPELGYDGLRSRTVGRPALGSAGRVRYGRLGCGCDEGER